MCLGFVKDYGGFLAVRALLGLTEGGLLPGIVSCSIQSRLLILCPILDLGLVLVTHVQT